MAELHSLWGKEQEAMNRARYAAVTGKVKEEQAALQEVAKLRQTRDQVKAQETSASASARQAETLAGKEAFEQKNYPREMALKEQIANAQLAHATRPGDFEQRIKLATEKPELYERMFGDKARTMTQDQMADNWKGMSIQEKMARKARANGDILKAEQDYYKEVRGLASSANKPTGAPAVGTIQGGYRFKGGDPGSPSSWERV
jgi:hypothetical protein